MADILDFVKHKAEREVEEYLADGDMREDDIMCYGCPQCDNPTFILTTDKEILCAECDAIWGIEEEEE